MTRLSDLSGQQFDLAIVGGGIIGSGIARDAALRGLRVALFEARDFGSGTTAASTRIVHGGLRYLEMLDFRLVRMDLRERETLLRIASHLVQPLEFLIPLFSGDRISSLKLRAGLALYDMLSPDKSLPSRRWLSSSEARSIDAALERPDIRGAAAYYDARVDSPERLALENLLDAHRRGARLFNYCDVTSVAENPAGLLDVGVRDVADRVAFAETTADRNEQPGTRGPDARISARIVVNATGAWLERATRQLTGHRPQVLRTTKGVHIVCPPLTSRALVLYSAVDRRLLFAIPRAGLTWIGTTDTDFDGDPAQARATRADVEYLIGSVRHLFPALRLEDVLYTTAGVRALVRQRGSASSVSRMHRIVEDAPSGPKGLISVLGGKITAYRAIAEEVTDLVCRRLGVTRRHSVTAHTPLPGAGPQPADAGRSAVTRHLYALYGARGGDVVALAQTNPEWQRPLSTKYPDIGAQVVFSVRHEHALRLSDVLKRRTLLGVADDQGWEAAAPAAALMGTELGWSSARVSQEVEAYRREIAGTQDFTP
jgi:glycerol-3-phosphate dehydrogenase